MFVYAFVFVFRYLHVCKATTLKVKCVHDTRHSNSDKYELTLAPTQFPQIPKMLTNNKVVLHFDSKNLKTSQNSLYFNQ